MAGALILAAILIAVGAIFGSLLGAAAVGFDSGTILLAVVMVVIGSIGIPFIGGKPGFLVALFLYAFAAGILGAAMLTA